MNAAEAIAIITGAQVVVTNRDPDKFVEAINRAILELYSELERRNPKPLTIEDLRQMDGEPVWVKPAEEDGLWCRIMVSNATKNFEALIPGIDSDCSWVSEEYGKTWEAYRHKPKEVKGT